MGAGKLQSLRRLLTQTESILAGEK